MNQGLNNKSKAIIIKQPYPNFIKALNLSKNTKSNHEIPKEQQQIATQRTQRTIIPSIKSISNKTSQEKIRVYDVFKQIPRNKSQSYHNHINKMDESRDILSKLNDQKKINDDCQKTSRFLESVLKTHRIEPLSSNKKRSYSNAQPLDKLFKMNDNSISYIKPPLETQRKIPKTKTNLKLQRDDNILDLLLLNTCELKKKLLHKSSNNSSFICIRPGKLPKDFFIYNQ
ncbi:unnamed protein product [Paramecium octaurelia]|uniref:Uncharacterized protein n=1 Tax=Paramecium octaurelia TaxID=43137 RepID=A0A8S1WXE0_PAROT|nr:unnamed protein product [Paramecium octaurelia]